MINRNILILLECDAIKACGKSEYALYHLGKFEVRTYHLCIDIIFFQLKLVRIESSIPWHEFKILSIHALCHLLQFLFLSNGSRLIGINKVVKQFIYICNIGCHTLYEDIISIGMITEQLSRLAANIDQSLADIYVISLIFMRTESVVCHKHFLSEVAVFCILHKRTITWEVESKHPTIEITLLCLMSCRLFLSIRETFKVILISDMEGESLLFFQQILRKLERKHTAFLCESTELSLSFLIEERTTTDETVVTLLQETLFLRCERAMIVMYSLDAFKQSLIETHVISMLCQRRLNLLCQCVHLIIRLSRKKIEENGRHFVKQSIVFILIILFDNRVIKCRRLRIIDDFVYMLIVTAYSFHESLFVIFELYLVERRHFMYCSIFAEKWILSHCIVYLYMYHGPC